ncbi:hypothetical protein LQW54_007685 [Pestalotiopsis sp. IQ-011]
MYTYALSSFALFAGISVASPASPSATVTSSPSASSTAIPADAKFGLMALRSASPIHFAQFDAAVRGILLDLPDQNATCASGTADSATFYLKDGGLYLYTTNITQQLYVDASGMGQGVFQYATGNETLPTNAQTVTFALDEYGDLTMNGAGFFACPNSIEGAYSVWVDAGVANPGGHTDCLGFSARAVEITDPVSCDYTIE